ncbi:uncharacterized protein BO96DRAFT_337333 [Aspergillus niger CBS 101883]|uniref:uncharacterized protein n=1 Tax=Aspergillus lacticoffeatus (strain CBS 101883) TaxID=1450533 RepID=UPI000D7FABA9|nr:uncharacterized protein BO96DRAFT_337333 [Aspergillus niger CBS 101883]PYH56799.1 hypothetical protein BO96DRAFT_337333 [Aspergillus niger CBS 101883]
MMKPIFILNLRDSITIITTTTKVPVKSRHASGASLGGPQENPTRHGVVLWLSLPADHLGALYRVTEERPSNMPLRSIRSSACRNKAVSRGAYAFEKVGKGWTAERSNPDTRPALTRPAARISTASVWRSNPGKFDSFTITSEVLDPLSEPCSGPTQSTPQLVLYLMEGCYELAGPGTTRDTHDDLPVGRKGVNNLGTSRLGFHLSGNIEHLRSLFSGGSVSSIPLVIRYPFYFLLCTKDAVDQLRREGQARPTPPGTVAGNQEPLPRNPGPYTSKRRQPSQARKWKRKSLLISAGAHRPDNFGTLAVCIDPGRRRPMSTITVLVPLGIDLDPRGRIP